MLKLVELCPLVLLELFPGRPKGKPAEGSVQERKEPEGPVVIPPV